MPETFTGYKVKEGDNFVDAFRDIEWYFEGCGLPLVSVFSPIGEENNLYQEETQDSFSFYKGHRYNIINSYRGFDGEPLHGAYIGTVPKATPYEDLEKEIHCFKQITTTDTDIKIWTDSEGLHVGSEAIGATIFSEEKKISRGIPNKIGIVLIGGGGGCGGRG